MQKKTRGHVVLFEGVAQQSAALLPAEAAAALSPPFCRQGSAAALQAARAAPGTATPEWICLPGPWPPPLLQINVPQQREQQEHGLCPLKAPAFDISVAATPSLSVYLENG